MSDQAYPALVRVESDLARGDLGKARDRLHGLIHSHPNDLELRSRLAEVYWQLRQPDMAGLYWFLEEYQTETTVKAVDSFIASSNNNADEMHRRLKLKLTSDDLAPGFAHDRLDMIESALRTRKKISPFGIDQKAKIDRRQGRIRKVPFICSGLGILLLLLFATLIYTLDILAHRVVDLFLR